MTIDEFEQGKFRIMAEAREALRRVGFDHHTVMFDVHGTVPLPEGATLTVTTDGATMSSWFPAAEIAASSASVARADVRQKVASLVAGVREAVN